MHVLRSGLCKQDATMGVDCFVAVLWLEGWEGWCVVERGVCGCLFRVGMQRRGEERSGESWVR